jgi:5'-methylthioadenosine phosphorylase
MPEAALARELALGYAAICPIVNHAAGLGDSKLEIARAELAATREEALGRILKILAVFVAARD